MPYIKQSARPKYQSVIDDTIKAISCANVPQTSKVEYFGFFVNTLAERYVQIPGGGRVCFNSYLFPEATRKQLIELSGKVATLVGAGDPMEAAGELNYAITSILWALSENAGYGLRTFLSGSIRKVLNDLGSLTGWQVADQKERVMAHRRLIIALGVLNDVLDETYRRRTSVYEDLKITENGDV